MSEKDNSLAAIMSKAESLVEAGNEKLLKASEQEGILASALLAASGLGAAMVGKPGIAEVACLLATVGLAVVVHLSLGIWEIRTGVKLGKGGTPKSTPILAPTIGLVTQSLAFAGGLGLFLIRIAFH
jgi:hypothetical protein